jgi:RhoGAP domain
MGIGVKWRFCTTAETEDITVVRLSQVIIHVILKYAHELFSLQEFHQEWDSLYSRGKPITLDALTVHEAAGLLKLFLRELPAPLLTLERVDAFIQVNSKFDL